MEITLDDIREAMRFIEDAKPKCEFCNTAFDSYCGILGFNCKCGCKRDAETPAGRDRIAILKRIFEYPRKPKGLYS